MIDNKELKAIKLLLVASIIFSTINFIALVVVFIYLMQL